MDYNAHLKMSPTGLAIVKAFESCLTPVPGRKGFFKPYLCPAGKLTIGWGHTNDHEPKFTTASVWSQKQCDDALAGVMITFENHVKKLSKVALKQCEFDALVSWAYNTGGPATATLWRKLNAGDKASVPRELAKWNKGGGKVLKGLTRRRKSEAELFAGDFVAALRTAQVKGPVPASTSRPQVTAPPTSVSPASHVVPPKPSWLLSLLATIFKRKPNAA